jgi:hypothetical protein
VQGLVAADRPLRRRLPLPHPRRLAVAARHPPLADVHSPQQLRIGLTPRVGETRGALQLVRRDDKTHVIIFDWLLALLSCCVKINQPIDPIPM